MSNTTVSDTESIRLQLLYGSVELRPHRWIKNEQGHSGQQWLKIERDRDDREVSRMVCEPVCWLYYD